MIEIDRCQDNFPLRQLVSSAPFRATLALARLERDEAFQPADSSKVVFV